MENASTPASTVIRAGEGGMRVTFGESGPTVAVAAGQSVRLTVTPALSAELMIWHQPDGITIYRTPDLQVEASHGAGSLIDTTGWV